MWNRLQISFLTNKSILLIPYFLFEDTSTGKKLPYIQIKIIHKYW